MATLNWLKEQLEKLQDLNFLIVLTFNPAFVNTNLLVKNKVFASKLTSVALQTAVPFQGCPLQSMPM
jgi:hypothetical protein